MAPQRRRFVLHIGTGKTGTTAIQDHLASAREELAARGFYYPRTWVSRHHEHLMAILDPASRRWRDAPAGAVAGGGPPADGGAGGVAATFGAELRELPPGIHTVIVSSETLYNQGQTPGAVERLRAFLGPHAEDCRVLVYLRRQDERAVSAHSTRVKAGRGADDPFAPPEAELRALDYAAGLEPWALAFGDRAVQVRIFDRAELRGGDAVEDFLEASGIGPLMTPRPARAPNASLGAAALDFMRRVNAAIEAERGGAAGGDRDAAPVGRPTALRRILAGERFAGPALLPPRAAAEAFYSRFRAGNARVAARYLPGRERLFREDFSRYPEAGAGASPDAVLDVAAAVVLHLLRDAERHAAERLLARGRAAEGRGDVAAAGEHYALAIGAGAGSVAYRRLAALGLEGAERARVRRIAAGLLPKGGRRRLDQALAGLPEGSGGLGDAAEGATAPPPPPGRERARPRDPGGVGDAAAASRAAAQQARREARRAARRAGSAGGGKAPHA